MDLTISLDEPLAVRLRERAAARSIAPEDAARDLLGAALAQPEPDNGWRVMNERRVELIYKEMRAGLTGDERTELEHLQGIVAARLAPVDRQLIAGAQEVLRRAKEMRDAASP